MRRLSVRLAIVLALVVDAAASSRAAAPPTPLVHVELLREVGSVRPGWTFWAALSQQTEHAARRRPSLEAGPITLEVNRGQPAEATAAPLESVTVVAELDGGVARQAFALRTEPRSNPTVLAVLNIPLVRRLEEKS